MPTDISRKRLVSDSTWSIATAVFNSVFAAAYLVLIGNHWKSDGLGVFSIAISSYLIGSILFNLGLHNAILYFVADPSQNKKQTTEFVYTALSASLVSGIFGSMTGFVFAPLTASIFHQIQLTEMIRVFAFALPLFMINKTAIGVLNAHRKMARIAMVNLVRGFGVLMYLLTAIKFDLALETTGIGFILSEALICPLVIGICVKSHRLAAPSFEKAVKLISFGFKAALSGIIGDINSRLDILVIGIFCTASEVGVYSVASAIAKSLWLLPCAIQRVTNPLIVELYSSGKTEKLHRTMDVMLRLATSLFVVTALSIVVYIRPLINLLYPGKIDMLEATGPAYFLLAAAGIFAGVATVGSAPSTAIGKPENALKISGVVFGANIAMNFSLVPFFGPKGAACATAISLLSAMVYFAKLCRAELKYTVPLIKLAGLFFVMCLMISFAALIDGGVVLIPVLAVMAGTFAGLKIVHKTDIQMLKGIIKSFV